MRTPLILLTMVTGLVPHLMVLYSAPMARLEMIVLMHMIIVPTAARFALAAVEERTRHLELANAELRRIAADLSRRNEQNDALNAAVRLLAGAPSVAAVIVPLSESIRQVARADLAEISWRGQFDLSDTRSPPLRAVARAPDAANGGDPAREERIELAEGGHALGQIVLTGPEEDEFTHTCLSILTREIGLHWRLRKTEAATISALYPAGEESGDNDGEGRTRKLLRVICDALHSDSAALYLLRAEAWRQRAACGRPMAEELTLAPGQGDGDDHEMIWQEAEGRRLCIRGAADGILVLEHQGDTDWPENLNLPLLQMIVGHSAALLRAEDGFQNRLWSERRRIARELHDDVCQSIAALHMQLGHLETLLRANRVGDAATRSRDLRRVAMDCYDGTRIAVDGFRQSPRDGETGEAFLQRIAIATCERLGVALDLQVDSSGLRAEAAWQLGRIIQEAVANGVRHGKASALTIRLDQQAGGLRMTIADDGTAAGDSPGERRPGRGHHGIDIMAERAGELGGTFDIGQKDGRMTITVDLPSVNV